MKLKVFLLSVFVLFTSNYFAEAQNKSGKFMEYEVIDGDTVYLDMLSPSRVLSNHNMSKRDWIQYCKRVHNFSKAYPYALFVANTIFETDSIFVARKYNDKEQDRYLNVMKDELLKDFDPIFRQLTLTQGLMMIRLIDREVGMPPYYLIQKYLGNINAGFWQGIAKMLKGDIKRQYDPMGEDEDLEELVKIWNDGKYDELYESIFAQKRPTIVIPEKFKTPFYQTVDAKKNKKEERKAKRNAKK